MKHMLRSPVENGGSGEMPPKPADKAKNGGPQRNREQLRVLIVDDEDYVARSTARPLKRRINSENIVFAENALQALERLKDDSAFDVIMLDLGMPGEKGTYVVEELERRGRQDIIDKIVIYSGTISKDMKPHVHELVNGRVLQKPTEPSNLIEIYQYAQEGRVNEWRPPNPNAKKE